jgi:phosphoribosylpyrophosphate synthetase
MGIKEIEVFKVITYPVLNDISGLRKTAVGIDEAIKNTFLGHAKLALVGCGTSGASMMTAVSLINNLDCCIVAKEHEYQTSHRSHTTLSISTYNHLIVVDDQICSGKTMRQIAKMLQAERESHLLVKMVCAKYAQLAKEKEILQEIFPSLKYICY